MEAPPNTSSMKSQSLWYDWDFIEEPPERFQCGVCFQVMQCPHLPTCCGQQYLCTNCISQVRKHAERAAQWETSGDAKPTCPFCRKEDFETTASTDLQSSIHSVRVRCPHAKEGCEWTGTICEAQSKHLSSHCIYHPITCPNNCGASVRRCDSNIMEHLQICPDQMVSCPFAPAGCRRTITRKHIPVHSTYSLHDHFLQTTEKLCKTPAMNASLVESLQGPPHQEELKRREANITAIKKRVLKTQETNLALERGLQAVQQEIDSLEKDLQKSNAVFAAELKRKDDELRGLRVLEGELRSELAVVPTPQTSPMRTPPVTFYLDNFKERMAHNESWFSPPFYSHDGGGYKMCLQVNPNGQGRGEGTHVSVFIHFMPGEYDDALKWPFEGRISVVFENQQSFLASTVLQPAQSTKGNFIDQVYLEDQNHLANRQQVPRTDILGGGSGNAAFIAHGQLRPFLSSDTLKITILPILFLPL